MTIITISRGSYSCGKEIAEAVAATLNYECVDREVFLEASGEYNLPEIKLIRAIHDAPSVLERIGHSKERYIARFEAAFLRHMMRDNVVYHGLAGHYFLQGVPHVLKIRIIADMDLRVKQEMKRESIPVDEARRLIRKDDEERRSWSAYLFGIDTSDASLYDAVFNIQTLTTDQAAETICRLTLQEQFKTTKASRQALKDRLVAAEVKLHLLSYDPYISVGSDQGKVTINTRGAQLHHHKLQTELAATAMAVDGVEEVNVEIDPHTGFA